MSPASNSAEPNENKQIMTYPPFPNQKRLFDWTDSAEVAEFYGLNENSIQQWLVADIRWDQYCTEDYFPEIIRSIVGEYRQYLEQQNDDN